MTVVTRLRLADVEQRVCDIAAEQLGICRARLTPDDRLIEDLRCDSLDLIDFFMALEDGFAVTLPAEAPTPVYKAVFTRQPFRLADLAEMVYLQQGTGTPQRRGRGGAKPAASTASSAPFTQLDGRWRPGPTGSPKLLEPLPTAGPVPQYRRRSDGMRCLRVPAASVEIGCDAPDAFADERPRHVVELDAFLIDAEPVSTTAFCRFLNSVGEADPEILADWCLLDDQDHRKDHLLVERAGAEWRPVPGAERWPMILVSWYGANAYSLWANGRDWQTDRAAGAESFLPTEAQWEYAARGARYQEFPWGAAAPTAGWMRSGQHRRSITYRADALPMADVNDVLGMSPFGLHHMAGNVWQWCRDWYADDFYRRAEARGVNPVNTTPTQARSERGGSWVGPAGLCRSSYRRGRPPAARGRCLGFRCISSAKDAP